MGSVPVYNLKGEETGRIELDGKIFTGRINERLLHQAVVMYLANRRQGNADTKTRSEISGGGRKPWRQKGTGRARAGSNRSPLWRGGGTSFGPQPRDYGYQMPRTAKREALVSALQAKLRDNELMVVERIAVESPKTKNFVQLLSGLEAAGKKGPDGKKKVSILVVMKEADPAVVKAGRNLSRVTLKTVGSFSTYDLLVNARVLFAADAWKALMARISAPGRDQKGN